MKALEKGDESWQLKRGLLLPRRLELWGSGAGTPRSPDASQAHPHQEGPSDRAAGMAPRFIRVQIWPTDNRNGQGWWIFPALRVSEVAASRDHPSSTPGMGLLPSEGSVCVLEEDSHG